MSSESTFRLIVIEGPEAGRAYDLDKPQVVIGRAPDAEVVISSQVVSRHHARIIFQSGQYFIEDNRSANGTYLNGERLNTRQLLNSGDKIMLGEKICLEFQLPEPVTPRKDTIALSDDTNRSEVPTEIGLARPKKPDQPGEMPATARASSEQDRANYPDSSGAAAQGSPGYTPEHQPSQVIITVAGESPQTHLLISPQITIGREDDNGIAIHSQIISRHHARLEAIPGGYRLVILPGNTNETYVNGLLISGAVELEDNSLIRVGSAEAGQLVTIQFLQSTHADPQPARNIQLGPQAKLMLGRDPRNDIVLEAPPVSRFHAEVERVGQRYRIRDLNSVNGTYVNNQRIKDQVWARPQDTVRVGPYLFVLGEDVLAQIDQSGGLRVDAVQLQKWVRKDLNLLQEISLVLQPREFVVVVGQSGGGKTTLVDALAGYRPATQGQVYINDIQLYRHFDAVRDSIGYVPQRDIIHMELTVSESLDYAARLRMPPDTSAQERHTRIMQVLDDLDLTHRKDGQNGGLSGGQQKRVSIGVELLTKPGLFFLDEPTSGLDPGTETSLMQLMRRLADQGRTIVLITHATKNVMLADKVVFLARGGYLAWFGPPDEALSYFSQYQPERERRIGGMDFDQIYAILDDPSMGSPADWQTRFQQTTAYQRDIVDPLRARGHDIDPQPEWVRRAAGVPAEPVKRTPKFRPRPADPLRIIRQFAILSARNLRILSRDRISLFLMLAAAPLVGMLDFVLASGMEHNPYDYQYGDFSPIAISLFLFTIYGVLVGGLSQMREIVKEKAVYRRERLVNLQILPYVASKMWVAGLLALYQAFAYTLLHYLAFDMPGGALEFGLIYVTIVLATFAGMMIGLFASALAPNSNTVPLLVILLMIPQIVIGGALIPLPGAVTAITSTRWAFQSIIGITGVGADLAADPCWELPYDSRGQLSLEDKEALGCLCLGINVLRQESCEFPGLGLFYTSAIDQPEPVKPADVGDPPVKPDLPQPPQEPADQTDPVAMNAYLQALKAYQERTTALQAQYALDIEAYQARVNQYQQDLIAYQETLAEWQINRNESIGQAEAMLGRFERLFGWAAVDKGSDEAFTKMILKTWAAQVVIIVILFGLILFLMKMKDRDR